MTEKSTEVASGSSSDVSEDDLLGHSDGDSNEEVQSDGLNATLVPDTFSDDHREFHPELPTRMELSDPTTAAKYVVVQKKNPVTDKWEI